MISTEEGFLKNYFEKSRLHKISTWKGDLVDKCRVAMLDKRASTATTKNRLVLHVDFDCFFVQVSLFGRPEGIGKPCVVTHAQEGEVQNSSSTAQIAACSYEAREKGINAGMYLGEASRVALRV
jgi:DNA repair protein REV1